MFGLSWVKPDFAPYRLYKVPLFETQRPVWVTGRHVGEGANEYDLFGLDFESFRRRYDQHTFKDFRSQSYVNLNPITFLRRLNCGLHFSVVLFQGTYINGALFS